jgi:tRNA(fMet)-specific endonuclease VapC
MGLLIDASILIEHERGRLDVASRVDARPDVTFFVSVITISELLHGVHRAADSRRRARRSAFVEAVVEDFPLLGIDLPTARSHAGLWADLASRGELIGAHDLWLAAAAVAHDLTLVTANMREFGRVPGLTHEDWSPD